jgi:hypothetical protein
VAHHGQHHAFSRGWYGHHRGAWGWGSGGYGWGNPWAAASLGAAAGWLGADALADDFGVNNETVYTSDGAAPADDQADQSSEAAPDQVSNEPQEEQIDYAAEAAEAAKLAAGGATEPGADAKFLPLGVYTFAPEGQNEASAIVHLAISKQGVVRGTYFDINADKDENIQGAVDKKTGRVAWTVGPQGKVVFHTFLQDLTQPSGPVSVHFENGKTGEWTIARYTEDDAKKSGAETKAPFEAKTGAQENGQNQ